MPDRNPLDLSAIDPPIWRIMVEDAVYGPYTLGQMKAFSEEGRLSDISMVATEDGSAFKPAFQYPELRSFIPGLTEHETPEPEIDPANYLITVQADGEGRRAVISVLNECGRFAELMPGSFILHAPDRLVEIREKLSTVLAERGRFIIVNASTGQLAWMGLRDDAGAHAKIVWKRDD